MDFCENLAHQRQELSSWLPSFKWEEQPSDYCATGLLSYLYADNHGVKTYFTPVRFFISKFEADWLTPNAFRCSVQLHKLGNLSLSTRAKYIEWTSGAIRPQKPYVFTEIKAFIDSIVALFQSVPPLISSQQMRAFDPVHSLPIEKWVSFEVSAFCDGALRYDGVNCLQGIIPCGAELQVPVIIILDAAAIDRQPQVFVMPHDEGSPGSGARSDEASFILVETKAVNGNSGEVTGLVSLMNWSKGPSLCALLRELQATFMEETPLRAVCATPSKCVPCVEDHMLCIVCLVEAKKFVAYPCGHLLFCKECSEAYKSNGMSICPVCRRNIHSIFEMFT